MLIINSQLRALGDIVINFSKKYLSSVILVILLSITTGAVSAFDVYLGESVDLGGSCTSDYIYLFIIGPNLPSNGANPEDIYEEVVTGSPSSFVTVSAFNNRWSYTWDTKTAGGNPDAGTYTFYAVERPLGRNDLSGADYSTKTVTLLDPSISVSGTSSSKENTEYSISSGNPEETGAFIVPVTEEGTPVPSAISVTGDITETIAKTEIPATGIPPVLLILSVFMSFFIVLARGKISE